MERPRMRVICSLTHEPGKKCLKPKSCAGQRASSGQGSHLAQLGGSSKDRPTILRFRIQLSHFLESDRGRRTCICWGPAASQTAVRAFSNLRQSLPKAHGTKTNTAPLWMRSHTGHHLGATFTPRMPPPHTASKQLSSPGQAEDRQGAVHSPP